MGKIKMLVPEYLKGFNCIGDSCEDTCCKDWNITVDKNTYQKYKRLNKGDYNPLLNSNIRLNKDKDSPYNYAKINLKENSYCPFFNEKRLCDIYINLSYDYMPTTCRMYPRHINKIDNDIEMSLSLSCPEAARKALLPKDIMRFEHIEIEYEEYMKLGNKFFHTDRENLKKEEYRYFWDIRIAGISILQNRKFNIVERLVLLGMLYKKVEKCINNKEYKNIPKEITKFINIIDNYDAADMLSNIEQNKGIQSYISKMLISERVISRKNLSKKTIDFINGADKVDPMSRTK